MQTISLLLDMTIVGALLLLAWQALFCPALFAAVVFFISFSLLLSLAWARMQAPDVALAEAAIGAGLTGALLLGCRATSGIASRRSRPTRRPVMKAVMRSEHAPDRTGEDRDRLLDAWLGRPPWFGGLTKSPNGHCNWPPNCKTSPSRNS